MATAPVFAITPVIGMGQVSAANTNRDGTGTTVAILTGSSSGTLIRKVRIVATGTTTAGVVRLFLDDGTNVRLIQEVLVSALTPGVAQEVFSRTLLFSGDDALHLPSTSWVLKASTQIGETFNVFAFGANL